MLISPFAALNATTYEGKLMTTTFAEKTLTLFALIAALGTPFIARAQSEDRPDLLFVQRDRAPEFVLDFAANSPVPVGGHGIEVGTHREPLRAPPSPISSSGASAWTIALASPTSMANRIILAPIADPTSAADFQVYGATGSGIVLTGTYQVVATTGKYVSRYRIGQTFRFKSIATNPSFPPASAPAPGSIVPGTEYVEVYRN